MQQATRRIVIIIALSIAIPIVPFAAIGELPGERWLEAQSGNAYLFGATGSLLLALDVLLPIPSSILGALLGGRLGFLAGFAWTFLGLMVGNMGGYFLGKKLFARRGELISEAPALLVLFVSRPVPVLAEAVAFAAGASRSRVSHVLWVSAAGNSIYAAALAGSGAAWLPEGWAGPGLVLPLLLPTLGFVIWKYIGKVRGN